MGRIRGYVGVYTSQSALDGKLFSIVQHSTYDFRGRVRSVVLANLMFRRFRLRYFPSVDLIVR